VFENSTVCMPSVRNCFLYFKVLNVVRSHLESTLRHGALFVKLNERWTNANDTVIGLLFLKLMSKLRTREHLDDIKTTKGVTLVRSFFPISKLTM